jgi:hypothetical protein
VLFVSTARKPHPQMLVCLAAIVALVLASSAYRSRARHDWRPNKQSALAFGVGLFSYPWFIVSSIVVAIRKVPAFAYFAVVAAIFAVLAVLCRRYRLLLPPAVARLGAGAYCAASLFCMATGFAKHSTERIVTGGVLATAFLVLAFAGFPAYVRDDSGCQP